MKSLRLSRRTVLRGLGGLGVALPALEIMAPRRASAAAIPKRFVFAYGGTSIGSYGKSEAIPAKVGTGYDTPYALASIATLGVSSDVSIVTGLKIPYETGGTVPPGGRLRVFHGTSIPPQSSGLACKTRWDGPSGTTCDQLVARVIGVGTRQPVLAYRVQPNRYSESQAHNSIGRLSFINGKPVEPVVSPRLAWTSLFEGFAPAADGEKAQALAQLARRRSILDLVKTRADRLRTRLGVADRNRLARHFDEVRSLETRLSSLEGVQQSSCKPPLAPGQDPPIGASHAQINGGFLDYKETAGWSNEELRASLLCDFIHHAFACDISRVASLMLTWDQCFMNMTAIAGHKSDLHELGHGKGFTLRMLSDGVAWHVKHFARLVQRLGSSLEVDGSRIIDHTALALTFEGSHGFDPYDPRDDSPHSTDNMIVIVGGRAGGLKSGRHIAAPGKHPAAVVGAAMAAVGVPGGLGDLKVPLPDLLP
jgi:Protein of unknown function (DUF1552)